jgi:hypothetical protein
MPKSRPDIIKEYKNINVRGDVPYLKKTGIYIEKGEIFSILAKGNIRMFRGSKIGRGPGTTLAMMIGNKIVTHNGYDTIKSEFSGVLKLGVVDGAYDYKRGKAENSNWYKNNLGQFHVDLIIWRTNNYSQIAECFADMKKEDPDNIVIHAAVGDLNPDEKIELARKTAAQEMETTRKEIRLLQGKPIDPKELQSLEQRLAKLTATLAELEQMKRELGMERQKSEQLSQQLAEKEQREQQLLSKLSEGVKNPPVLLVAAPPHGMRTEAKSVQLSAVVQDEKGLQQLDIFVNSQKVNPIGGRGIRIADGSYPHRLEIEQRIGLSKGANIIRIHATDTDGLFVEKSLTAFYDLLVMGNQVPAENVFLLLNEQATLPALRSTLGTKVKNKAGANDMVIIYFAGHGATERDMMSADGDGLEKYLLPYEANPDDLYASALPMREVAHIFHRIRSERLVFVADACYSGASGGRTVSVTGVRANLSDRFLERLAGGKGKVIITASSANEVSVEKDELGHGVFTYYLMQGLRGPADTDADGLVTVDEAYRYVSEKVPAATGQEQHPVKKGSVEGQLVMGIVP